MNTNAGGKSGLGGIPLRVEMSNAVASAADQDRSLRAALAELPAVMASA
ncbi:MAG: hypothetical protein IT467_01380, partial [Dokdonella sp.]|nr:hypothetical protein [Dokdonella sp.]